MESESSTWIITSQSFNSSGIEMINEKWGGAFGANQIAHDLTHRGGKGGRFARSSHGEMHPADNCAFLPPRRVKQRLVLFAPSHVFGISDDTDDLELAFANAILYRGVSFKKDGSGFYYNFQRREVGVRVFSHAIGTDSSKDVDQWC
jgi:hypothetical protein